MTSSSCRYDIIIDTNLKPWLIEVCICGLLFLLVSMPTILTNALHLLFSQECIYLQKFHCNQAARRIPVLYYRLNISLFMHVTQASLVPRPFLKEKTRRNEKHFSYELHLTCSVLFSVPQVNASPSLSHTTPSDRIMKTSLINDIINIVLSPSGFPEYASMKSCNREKHKPFPQL